MREQGWGGALGIAVAALWIWGLIAFRHAMVEPEAWGEACAVAHAPFACLPRTGMLWLERFGLWGIGGTVAGFAAFRWDWLALPAVLLGLGGVFDYDVGFGMLGFCLGAWAWLSRPRPTDPDRASLREAAQAAAAPAQATRAPAGS